MDTIKFNNVNNVISTLSVSAYVAFVHLEQLVKVEGSQTISL